LAGEHVATTLADRTTLSQADVDSWIAGLSLACRS
jgi:hypothetical protein